MIIIDRIWSLTGSIDGQLMSSTVKEGYISNVMYTVLAYSLQHWNIMLIIYHGWNLKKDILVHHSLGWLKKKKFKKKSNFEFF